LILAIRVKTFSREKPCVRRAERRATAARWFEKLGDVCSSRQIKQRVPTQFLLRDNKTGATMDTGKNLNIYLPDLYTEGLQGYGTRVFYYFLYCLQITDREVLKEIRKIGLSTTAIQKQFDDRLIVLDLILCPDR